MGEWKAVAERWVHEEKGYRGRDMRYKKGVVGYEMG